MSNPGNNFQRPLSKDYLQLPSRLDSQSLKSCKVLFNFVINYVATIKGIHNNMESAKSFVAEKKIECFEKVHHPIFLKLIIRKQNKHVELLLRRTNSNKNQILNITNVKEDHKNPQYFYLETIDNTDSSRSRTHIFNAIDESNMDHIRTDIPSFGNPDHMTQHNYSVPHDMTDIVHCIAEYCLTQSNQHVPGVIEKITQPLFSMISNKMKSSNSVKRKPTRKENKDIKNHPADLERATSTELMEKMTRKPTMGSLDFEFRSIENLPTASNNYENFSEFSSVDHRYGSHKELQTSSTQSSLNNSQNTFDFKSDSNIFFYKFENVLQDEMGLQYFKDFLDVERSSENINFWEAVNNFSKITDPKMMKAEANKIFLDYIVDMVNLECDVVDKIRKQLSTPTNDMFDVAKNHIYHLMKNDSYSRFIISNHFNSWQKKVSNSPIKHSSSANSLGQSKSRKSMFQYFNKNKPRLSNKESRKSSVQTLESEASSPGIASDTCKITFAYDLITYSHYVNITANRKINVALKKLDKKFNENDMIMFNETDKKIIHFNENMNILGGKTFIVEKSSLLRIGFVQNNMDTMLFENIWFVVKCPSHLCLSSAFNPVVKRLQVSIDKYCVIQEDNPKIKLEWDIPVSSLHNSTLLLLEQSIFPKVRIFRKSLIDTLDSLWKKIMKDNVSLPFDNDNILDSRSEFLSKNKLEARRVGHLISGESLETFIERKTWDSFDDQRGTFAISKMPDFLNDSPKRTSEDSSTVNSKHLSALNFGDSDISFSEFDESSDHSPHKFDFASDLE